MNKILNKILVLLILLGGFFILDAREISVSKNGIVKTIKQALQLAENGDVIIIHEGYYAEGNIIVDKSVTLKGVNFPIIDGKGSGEVFTINSDFTSLYGLTIKNAGVSFIAENAAIRLNEVTGCKIIGNRFYNNFFSVYLSKSSNSIIKDNFIKSSGQRETNSGNGIHLWYCKDISIENNYIFGHRDGIYLEFVENAEIKKNYSKNNLRYGLHFMFSDRCVYTSNKFENNGAGVAVMYSKNVEMISNLFYNNWGPASFGILLKDITDSKIEQNKFVKNTSAIYIEGCNRTSIKKNNFENNGWAIKLMANSSDNIFRENNFISNSFDLSTNSRSNFNTFEGNYWSEYSGYDLNKDGVGDVPHHPVRLFSILVEQQQASLILLNSLFIKTLDIAESVIPSLTPEMLIDTKPMMKVLK